MGPSTSPDVEFLDAFRPHTPRSQVVAEWLQYCACSKPLARTPEHHTGRCRVDAPGVSEATRDVSMPCVTTWGDSETF